jgi:hypothetical protein
MKPFFLPDNIDIMLFENGTDAGVNETKSTVERWEDVSTFTALSAQQNTQLGRCVEQMVFSIS